MEYFRFQKPIELYTGLYFTIKVEFQICGGKTHHSVDAETADYPAGHKVRPLTTHLPKK